MPIKIRNFQDKSKKLTLFLIAFFTFLTLFPINEIYANHKKVRIRVISPVVNQQITITPTRIPTPTKSPIPTRTPTPTKMPTPTPTVRPTTTPTPILPSSGQTTTLVTPTPTKQVEAASTTGDSKKDFIMQKINDYRKSLGLSEVKTDLYTCGFAKTRAQEIVDNFNHDGFTSRINSKTLPYPNYGSITENIAMTSDYTKVVDMWIASPGHAENMRKDTPFVCVEYSGNYYAYEGWKP